ncbi:MAG TPA: CotH kinase family protein, partial [Verrucomicrobiae bacterium]|nr:CotH kinase family protein [Verrucomicrobiae bacterium]
MTLSHTRSRFPGPGPGARMVSLLLLALPLLLSAQVTVPLPGDDLFAGTNIIRIAIQVSEEGMQTLANSGPKQNQLRKSKVAARVIEGGKTYTHVTVQLKGFSSFLPVDSKPSLTLNFDKDGEGELFHGLGKISLNNSFQDPLCLNEKVSRELFAAAGVPVPRADYALVTLNGRKLGLYVMTEGYDKKFLKRYFTRTDGNLYDGGVMQDINRQLQVTSGRNPDDHTGVLRLMRASREIDPDKRFHALESALDMDRFLSMVAMETLLCHSDSYSMNRNNYRLYHDPVTDKMIFMPHGMDRVLGMHRSGPELYLIPPTLGMVANAVLTTPEGRRRYLARAGVLFTNFFQPDRLCQRAREINSRIAGQMGSRAGFPEFYNDGGRDNAQGIEDFCRRVEARAADLKMQFSHLKEILAPTPIPVFEAGGSSRIDGWRVRHRVGRAEPVCEPGERNGASTLHLRVANEP